MSFTYTELKTAIQDFAENTESSFVTHLPDFIKNAEEKILQNAQLTEFRKNASGTLTSSSEFLQKPTDFLAPYSLSITNSSNKEFLLFKDVNFIQEVHPNSTTTGTPKYYGFFNITNFILAPTPDDNYAAEFHYFFRPTSLTASTFTLTVASSASFTVGETITGSTSGESTTITSKPTSTTMLVPIPTGSFTTGETITGGTSGATTTISSIGADSTLSWLSENAPLAMLYGALVEAYVYMKGEQDIMQYYAAQFKDAILRLKNFGEAKEVTEANRAGLVRVPKS